MKSRFLANCSVRCTEVWARQTLSQVVLVEVSSHLPSAATPTR
jgi:hypothetical protein